MDTQHKYCCHVSLPLIIEEVCILSRGLDSEQSAPNFEGNLL